MIIWINGAYGVGKSTVAKALHKMNSNSFIFDAEAVGNAVRDNLPQKLFNGYIFENYDLWFEMIVKLLISIKQSYQGDIYVPMTLVYQDSFQKIEEPLKKQGIQIKHMLLEANYETIHDRILSRGEEEGCWCMNHIDLCLNQQRDFSDVMRIPTDTNTPQEIAKHIIKYFSKMEENI